MFERFTREAREVMVQAQVAARDLQHDHIGTEHLLLGCLANTEIGAGAALTALGLTVDHVREQVIAIVGRGEATGSGQIPFTPRAKKVMELALRESLSRGHVDIESLHLLLGLVHDEDGVAMRIVLGSGVTAARVRETALAMIPAGERVERGKRGTEQARRVRPAGGSGPTFAATPDPALRRLLMVAAGRALADGREVFGVEDLRSALDQGPPSSEAASA